MISWEGCRTRPARSGRAIRRPASLPRPDPGRRSRALRIRPTPPDDRLARLGRRPARAGRGRPTARAAGPPGEPAEGADPDLPQRPDRPRGVLEDARPARLRDPRRRALPQAPPGGRGRPAGDAAPSAVGRVGRGRPARSPATGPGSRSSSGSPLAADGAGLGPDPARRPDALRGPRGRARPAGPGGRGPGLGGRAGRAGASTSSGSALLAPVRSTAEGRRLDLAIPPAASTRVDLVVPRTVVDASTGLNEPVAVAPAEGGPGRPALGPAEPPAADRAGLARAGRPGGRSCRPCSRPRARSPLEVERGSIRSRSSWVVGAIRGSAGQLALRLDPAEEVLDVEVDDRPVPFETRREGGRSVVVGPAGRAAPARTRPGRWCSTPGGRSPRAGRPGSRSRATRSTRPGSRPGRWRSPGPARSSSTRRRAGGSGGSTPGPSCPTSLRARPDTVAGLRVQRPAVRAGPGRRAGAAPAPGREPDHDHARPPIGPGRDPARLPGLAGPGLRASRSSCPRAWSSRGPGRPRSSRRPRSVPLDPEAGAGDGARGRPGPHDHPDAPGPRGRVVHGPPQGPVPRSTPPGRSPSRSSSRWPTRRPGAGSRSSPTGTSRSSRPSRASEPSAVPGRLGPAAGRLALARPAGPAPSSGLLWLRSDANPESLPLRVTVRPRSIRHESTLTATVDRRGAEVVDEIAGEVAFGTVSRLDLALPPEVPARWDVEGVELAGREPLGPGPRRDPPLSAPVRPRLRRRRSGSGSATGSPSPSRSGRPRESGSGSRRSGSWKGPRPASRSGSRPSPGSRSRPRPKGWAPSAPPEPSPAAEAGPPVRVALARADDKAGPVDVRVRLGPRLALPSLVVSRLWIRTVQRPEDDLATTASFWVESRDGSMTVGLPARLALVRARVGGREVGRGRTSRPSAADEYRLRFPASTPAGPVLVAVDYVVPASAASGRLAAAPAPGRRGGPADGLGGPAPRQPGRGRHPAGLDRRERMVLGRPALAASALEEPGRAGRTGSTAGTSAHRVAEPLDSGEQAGRHGYLFSRVGPADRRSGSPSSRGSRLLLLCSGPVLLAGLLVLARRPPPRLVGGRRCWSWRSRPGAFVEPDVADPGRSSPRRSGSPCSLAALAMNWALERRGQARPAGDGRP